MNENICIEREDEDNLRSEENASKNLSLFNLITRGQGTIRGR